jgi:hypothetical protein
MAIITLNTHNLFKCETKSNVYKTQFGYTYGYAYLYFDVFYLNLKIKILMFSNELFVKLLLLFKY